MIYRCNHINQDQQCQCQSKIFYVARIAELLQSPRRRSRVMKLCREKTDERGMFSDDDGIEAETGMTGCQTAMSFNVAVEDCSIANSLRNISAEN